MTATAITRRLLRDLKELERDPPLGISAAPMGDNLMLWKAVICGPNETPFEDGTFKLTIEQAAISWRASGDRQISLNASAERAFANFCDKKHRIFQLR